MGGESVALEPAEGGTAATLTFTGFNSTTRYCFRVTVEDEAHAPAEGRESASQSAIVGVNYIDTEIPELVSSLDFALSTGEEVQTLDLSFRPPLDGPLMIPITEYALVVGSRTFGSVACSVTDDEANPFDCTVTAEDGTLLTANDFSVEPLSLETALLNEAVTVTLHESIRDEANHYVALLPVDAMGNMPTLTPANSPHQPATAWSRHNPPTAPLSWALESFDEALAVSFYAPANDRFDSPAEPNQAALRYTFQCGFGDCETLEPCTLTSSNDGPLAPGSQETFYVTTPSSEAPACVVVDVYDWNEEQEVPQDWVPTRLRAVTHAPPTGVDRLDFDGGARVLSWDGVTDQAIDELAAVEHYAVIIGTQDFDHAACKLADLPTSQLGDWAMSCAMTGTDGVRNSAVDALDLGDGFPYSLEVPDLEPDGVTYSMTVIPVDDHGLGGDMPIGANEVIRYTTPQIYPNAPTLVPERRFSVAGYDVIFTFEAPADDGNPDDEDAEAVTLYTPLCTFVGRGELSDPSEQAYPTCASQGVDLTFYASEPKAPGQTETLHLVGLPAGGRICTQLGILDDYAAARIESDLERETWTLSSVAEVSLYDNPSSITDLTLSTGETAGALDVAFTAPDDGAGSYVTSYEYLVGSELPEVLPGCDERIANTWLTPQAPGLAEVHPLQNLSPETEMLVAVRSLRVANGFTFCSDWAVAMPEPTGCAAPLQISDLVCAYSVDAGQIAIDCLFSAPGDLPQLGGTYGLVDRYEAKVIAGTLNAGNFESVGDAVTGLPAPQMAGRSQTFNLIDIDESTHYEIAIRSIDPHECISGISNVAIVETPDITPPAQIAAPTVSSPTVEGGPVPIVAVTPSSTLNDAWTGNHVIDDDPSTAWASQLSYERREETLVLNLGSPQTIDRVRLKPDSLYTDFFPKTFRVEGTTAMTFEGQGELLVRETSLLIDDASELEWAFPPTEARLLKITTAKPQQSFGIYYSILADAQVLSARPASASLNINVRLPGDDGDEGRATCLVTFYGNAPYTFDELPQSARDCATIPALMQLAGDRTIRSQVASNLELAGALKTVSLTRLPGEESLYITLIAIDEAGNISEPRALPITTTSPIQPAAVSDLSGTPLSTDGIQLTFTAPASGHRFTSELSPTSSCAIARAR